MNYRYIISIALLIVLLSACKKEDSPLLNTDRKNLIYNGGCESEDCAEVSLDYILFVGDESIAESINRKITEFIRSCLIYNVDDTTMVPSIAKAAELFLSTYQKDKVEFPEISPYFAEVSVSESYRSEEFLCLEMKQYLYTGGAHGYGATWFLNVDIKTGEEIPTQDLLKNIQEFTNFAETKFREKMEIPMDESINATGFWFDDDTYYLPETLGFQEDQLVILYNPYDISSYASGMIELSIPLEEAIPYLQFK